MPVSVTTRGGQTLKSRGTIALILNDTEQALCSSIGGEVTQMSGYADLSKLEGGDEIVITHYVKIAASEDWKAVYRESYIGAQDPPILYIAKRPETHGIKLTIKQINGAPKQINFECFEES